MEAGKLTGGTNGFLVEDAMKGYITDMVVAQACAEFNHQIIDRLVLEAIWKGSGRKATNSHDSGVEIDVNEEQD